MLMKGEVEEVVVHSRFNLVTIVLRPDAVFKGQRVRRNVFRLKIDTDDFEDKVREHEEKMGIRASDRVAITYERKSETTMYIIWGLFIIGVFALLFFGGRNIRASIVSNNPFKRLGQAAFTLIDPQIRFLALLKHRSCTRFLMSFLGGSGRVRVSGSATWRASRRPR